MFDAAVKTNLARATGSVDPRTGSVTTTCTTPPPHVDLEEFAEQLREIMQIKLI